MVLPFIISIVLAFIPKFIKRGGAFIAALVAAINPFFYIFPPVHLPFLAGFVALWFFLDPFGIIDEKKTHKKLLKAGLFCYATTVAFLFIIYFLIFKFIVDLV